MVDYTASAVPLRFEGRANIGQRRNIRRSIADMRARLIDAVRPALTRPKPVPLEASSAYSAATARSGKRRIAARAACHPHMPCTPPPGGVDAEQM